MFNSCSNGNGVSFLPEHCPACILFINAFFSTVLLLVSDGIGISLNKFC